MYAYQQTGVSILSLADVLQTFVTEDILAHIHVQDQQALRIEHFYTDDVDELLRKNETEIKKLFNTFVVRPNKHILLKQVQELISSSKLHINEADLNYCIVHAQSSKLDPSDHQHG